MSGAAVVTVVRGLGRRTVVGAVLVFTVTGMGAIVMDGTLIAGTVVGLDTDTDTDTDTTVGCGEARLVSGREDGGGAAVDGVVGWELTVDTVETVEKGFGTAVTEGRVVCDVALSPLETVESFLFAAIDRAATPTTPTTTTAPSTASRRS